MEFTLPNLMQVNNGQISSLMAVRQKEIYSEIANILSIKAKASIAAHDVGKFKGAVL